MNIVQNKLFDFEALPNSFEIGDKVKTRFHVSQRHFIREVIDIHSWRSQTDICVVSIDDSGNILTLDAAWYEKAKR